MEPIQMPELVPDFLPGQTVYTIIDGLIYRVMIVKVHITLSLDPSVGFLYYVLADKLAGAGDRSVVSTTEVFPTKTELIDWLMDNVQNEGAS